MSVDRERLAELAGEVGQACERCQGNGEIVTDWDRYMYPKPGDEGDKGTTDCPDCFGTGRIPRSFPMTTTETVKLAEPPVPQHVIDAFENRYGRLFDLSRDDHEWRNTWRYKHDGVQSLWEGWRDCYLAALPAGETVKLAVKPLEWRLVHDETGMPIWRASKPFGSSYHVEGRDMEQWEWMGTIFDTIDSAKAAAQADCEARILSALALPLTEKQNGPGTSTGSASSSEKTAQRQLPAGGEVEPVVPQHTSERPELQQRLVTALYGPGVPLIDNMTDEEFGRDRSDEKPTVGKLAASPTPAPSGGRRDALLAIIKDAAINVAGRSANKRGPFVFDEAELQALASRLATPNPAPSVPVAWRVRERPGFDWRLTTGDPERDPRFRDQESQPLYAAPPSPQGVDLLGEMAKRPGWSLERGHKDPGDEEFSPYGWCVHEVRGNRSDREWTLIGFGDTPADALTAALSPTGRAAE